MTTVEKTWLGCICDRCQKPYRTDTWPSNSLCGHCDASKQQVFWRTEEAL